MSTDFLNALKARSVTVSPTVSASNSAVGKLLAKPVQAEPIQPLEVISVDRVLNDNRLDLKFNRIPTWEERQDFQNNGLRIKKVTADYLQWFTIQDNPENCTWLETRFNLSGLSAVTETILDDTQIETITENAPINDSAASNPVWEKYCLQVDTLCHVLKCERADLMLKAIDCLYRETMN